MSEEREVLMTFGAKLAPGAEEPLKQLARATKAVADEEVKYQTLLKDRVKSLETSLRLQKDLKSMGYGAQAGGGGSSNPLGTASGITGALGFSLPTTALAAFTAALGVAASAIHSFRASLTSTNHFSSGRFEDVVERDYARRYTMGLSEFSSRAGNRQLYFGLAGSGTGIPGGGLLGQGLHNVLQARGVFGNSAEDSTPIIAREKNLLDARDAQSYGTLKAQLEGGYGAQARQAELQRATLRDQPGLQANALLGSFRISSAYGAEATAAMGRAGGSYGYGAEGEDLARRYAFRSALAENAAQRDSALRGSAGRRGVLERQGVGLASEANRLGGELSGIGKALAGTEEGSDAQALRTMEYAKKQAEHAQALKALEENKKSLMAEEVGLAEQLSKNLENQSTIYKSHHSELEKIKQLEQSRRHGRQVSLGLMRPREQGAALQVAKKIHAGAALTMGELDFAKQHEDLFGPAIEKLGAERGAKINEQLEGYLPYLKGRGAAAGAEQASVEANVQVAVNVGAESIAEQISRGVIPVLAEMLQQAKIRLDSDLLGHQVQQQGNRNAPLIGQ